MADKQGVNKLYRHSLALLTDLYQLTMASGYWKLGRADERAAFNLFFRKHPFGGGVTVAAGLGQVIEFLETFRFEDEDVRFLATLTGNDGKPLFEKAFLDYLTDLRLTCDIDAVPEGTAVFPHEPLVRVTGPILQCQILETALLNMINFQTLIATKAARICLSAQGEPVLEFGLRRAQGVDGALTASRAAHIGGCAATSNVLAGKLFGIPVKGTHAHSWVMSFQQEPDAFEAYAQAMPNNCVFLVDTYDTLAGVGHAIEAGLRLRERGHEMVGIRLDSGDLAYLSIEARKLLDKAGFQQAAIVASNDLDEYTITSLKQQGATIAVWGVGTRLATAYDQPALGGVYKLSAIQDGDGQWQPKVKLSEQLIKVSNPGLLQVRRYRDENGFVADMIFDQSQGEPASRHIVDPMNPLRRRDIDPAAEYEELLVPVLRDGQAVYQTPPITEIRSRAKTQLEAFHPGVRRFMNPHEYPVGLEKNLQNVKEQLVLAARQGEPSP
jgi:nicotinate phosphoribosyltransferase